LHHGHASCPSCLCILQEDFMAGNRDKRELIEPHKGDKRYIRRDERGRIKESDDVSRSLSQDQKREAKTISKPGQGDRGDRSRE
jgi:hypothetical protein